jgi:hypothetical protein
MDTVIMATGQGAATALEALDDVAPRTPWLPRRRRSRRPGARRAIEPNVLSRNEQFNGTTEPLVYVQLS